MSTRYAYDDAGNLTSMIDGRGNTTTYAYDGLGRLTGRTDPAGNTLGWEYDARGNRTGQINRVGSPAVAVSWTYDGANRMTTRVADSVTVTYGYDETSQLTSAQGPAGTISASYDRLGRSLTVTAEDSSQTAYAYSFTAPTRGDPTGSNTFALDKFGRQTTATTPVSGTAFGVAYRADGQPSSSSDPNGNSATLTYDDAGRMLTKVTTGAGGSPTRASYSYANNRAGMRLSEASTISGDPANGTASFGYDALGRLTSYTSPLGTSQDQGYTWQEVINRAGLTTGGSTVTTTFNSSNRPTSDSTGGLYSHDLDGRLTARPGQTLEWDSLGRLTKVRDGAGSLISEYTYDALDRLRTVSRSGATIRFRYVGTSTNVAEIVDHGTGASQRKVATGWTGERLADWTASETRYYGTNGHHDVTWTADAAGAVSASLRYDPWGNVASSSGTSLPDFRFQGSWMDTASNLQWVVTRWYAPTLGRFVSEDVLLGEAMVPAARHLYAYGGGDPIGAIDPYGRDVKKLTLYSAVYDAPGIMLTQLITWITWEYWGGKIRWASVRHNRYGHREDWIFGCCGWVLERSYTDIDSPRQDRWWVTDKAWFVYSGGFFWFIGGRNTHMHYAAIEADGDFECYINFWVEKSAGFFRRHGCYAQLVKRTWGPYPYH